MEKVGYSFAKRTHPLFSTKSNTHSTSDCWWCLTVLGTDMQLDEKSQGTDPDKHGKKHFVLLCVLTDSYANGIRNCMFSPWTLTIKTFYTTGGLMYVN